MTIFQSNKIYSFTHCVSLDYWYWYCYAIKSQNIHWEFLFTSSSCLRAPGPSLSKTLGLRLSPSSGTDLAESTVTLLLILLISQHHNTWKMECKQVFYHIDISTRTLDAMLNSSTKSRIWRKRRKYFRRSDNNGGVCWFCDFGNKCGEWG